MHVCVHVSPLKEPAQRFNCFSTVIIVSHFKGGCFDSFWNFNLNLFL